MVKRLRSLASVLWDSDGEPGCVQKKQYDDVDWLKLTNLEKENIELKSKVSQLLIEVSLLKVQIPKQLPDTHASTVRSLASDLPLAWPDQAWLPCLPEGVLVLPRLRDEILPQLNQTMNAKHRIIFHLCKSPRATASSVLNHCEQSIQDLFKKYPCVFKIGMTSNPVKRWQHPLYGYGFDRREYWQGMKVLMVSDTSFSAALAESSLIRKFKNTAGCRNYNPGGETPSPEQGPHFTYVVYKILLPPHWPNKMPGR